MEGAELLHFIMK